MSALQTETGTILAADIGGSYIRMTAMVSSSPSHPADRTIRRRTPTEDADVFLATIEDIVAELATDDQQDAPLAIAVAASINPDTGVTTTANIPCLNGSAPGRILSARLGRPVLLLNDADAFALAEAAIGAGRNHRVVFGAVLGTGIGGGLVVDGRVVRGASGIAGEWGHGPVANQRPTRLGRSLPRMRCGCGQVGCADTFGGARGLERLHLALGHEAADSRAIIDGWKSGRSDTALTAEVWAEMLAEPLALALNTTGASIVPVGGGLGSERDLMALLDREVRARILPRDAPGPVVVPGMLKGNAGLIGAAILGRQSLEIGQ